MLSTFDALAKTVDDNNDVPDNTMSVDMTSIINRIIALETKVNEITAEISKRDETAEEVSEEIRDTENEEETEEKEIDEREV